LQGTSTLSCKILAAYLRQGSGLLSLNTNLLKKHAILFGFSDSTLRQGSGTLRIAEEYRILLD